MDTSLPWRSATGPLAWILRAALTARLLDLPPGSALLGALPAA